MTRLRNPVYYEYLRKLIFEKKKRNLKGESTGCFIMQIRDNYTSIIHNFHKNLGNANVGNNNRDRYKTLVLTSSHNSIYFIHNPNGHDARLIAFITSSGDRSRARYRHLSSASSLDERHAPRGTRKDPQVTLAARYPLISIAMCENLGRSRRDTISAFLFFSRARKLPETRPARFDAGRDGKVKGH